MKPKPLSSLNHFTVPVAIVFPPGYVHRETRSVLRATTARTLGTASVERLLDPYDESSLRGRRRTRPVRLAGAPRPVAAYGQNSFVGKTLELHQELPRRIHVVLIRHSIGF